MALAPAQARKRWSVSCASPPKWIHVRRCCPSTRLEPLITSQAAAMLAGLQQRPSLQPLLAALRPPVLCFRQHIHLAGRPGQLPRGAAIRGWRARRPANARPLRNRSTSCPRSRSCATARRSLPTLTTFMLSRPLSESASCKTLANEPSRACAHRAQSRQDPHLECSG